eukprot:CAMPEP_0172545298 /NCGR_PEP_ID=MMETSP1067-20121228/15248_1 /TAXON_ID=265564 ORGANISM="Thalassiosira punctigera, Strain Tpunct2005C2" /NCGR_SAMPLE_ID=MMETSP1067 /ASSEMBLY_ACC=CAM_ASM_000444 /LENGTH=329 /DNA_ID=CAMNT_0013332015 /DNA_START=92 /DNA_END=1081 /DNA_ORIENTATION=-
MKSKKGSRSERRIWQRSNNDDFIMIDSDSDDDVASGEAKRQHRATQRKSKKTEAAAAPCIVDLLDLDGSQKCAAAVAPCMIDLLELDVSDEENHENHSLHHRKKKQKSPSLASAEAADRELAEWLQREENLAAAEAANNDRSQTEWMRAGPARSRATDFRPSDVDANKRREEQKLREEQDDEYQKMLLADQIKDIGRRDEEEKKRRIEAEKEEADMLEQAKEASVLEDARALIKRTGGEPPIGSDGVTRLRFALPSGKKLDRRFYSMDTIKTVRAYLIFHFDEQGIDMKHIDLSTNFPKKTFGGGDDELTLEEAGLVPQALVMVINQDS